MLLPIALGCTKASFLFLYRRIFVVELVSKTNIFIVSIIVIDVLWMLGFSLAGLFECGTKFWAMQTYLQAFLDNCVDDLQLSLALAVSDLILDVIILLIPLPLVGPRPVAHKICGEILNLSRYGAFTLLRTRRWPLPESFWLVWELLRRLSHVSS
jgi:hypothetical protein